MVDGAAHAASPVLDHVVELWRRVLHIEDITPDEDFFELGGNSIVAVRLLPLIKETFGVEPNLALIFECPTPREFADALLALGVR